MAKRRPEVPKEIGAQVLVWADRTCCVCREPRRKVQIHHIDENPSNNDIANLAPLCLHCHDETQVKGGFGRQLDAAQVTLFRDRWYGIVEARPHVPPTAPPPPPTAGPEGLLLRLVREGSDLASEAEFLGHAATSTLRPPSPEEIQRNMESLRSRERDWSHEADVVLAGSPAARQFAETSGIPAAGFYGVGNRVSARVTVLRKVLGELADPATDKTTKERTPRELLSAAIADGMRLRTAAILDPDENFSFSDDPLYQWARRAYDVLRNHFVLFADEFYGEDPSLGAGYFAMAYPVATDDLGRPGYLASRLEILKSALRAASD